METRETNICRSRCNAASRFVIGPSASMSTCHIRKVWFALSASQYVCPLNLCKPIRMVVRVHNKTERYSQLVLALWGEVFSVSTIREAASRLEGLRELACSGTFPNGHERYVFAPADCGALIPSGALRGEIAGEIAGEIMMPNDLSSSRQVSRLRAVAILER